MKLAVFLLQERHRELMVMFDLPRQRDEDWGAFMERMIEIRRELRELEDAIRFLWPAVASLDELQSQAGGSIPLSR